MAGTLIDYGVDERGVATVALNDPASRNALSDELLDELLMRLDEARADRSVRVVVLTSLDDGVFSSGGNLKAFADDRPFIEKYGELERFPRLFEMLGDLGKPSLCAVKGDALAGAFGVALACDLIVAKQGARFGCPEINVGAFPFMISALIYRSVPRAIANELMLTGQLITAEQARELHIVNSVVPPEEFASEVLRWTDRLASRSPLLMQLGKDALSATRDMPLTDALNYLRGQLALAFTTDDMHEGVAAFRERRAPTWRRR